ncbi:MAG: hypothetical protein ACRD1T_01530 [Acidimicrobiia bacterium]
MRIARIIGAALCAALFVSCSSERTSPNAVTFESPKAKSSNAKFGANTLDFTAPKLGGGQVVGSEFVGKDVAIWFWAPW